MVKVQTLRRRQENKNETSPQQKEHVVRSKLQFKLMQTQQHSNDSKQQWDSESPHNESDTSPQLTSSQVSTINPSLSEEILFEDLETGGILPRPNRKHSLFLSRSIQSLPASLDMKHLTLTSIESEPDISDPSDSPQNATGSILSEPHPLSNAIISHASDLSTSECPTETHISKVASDTKWALPFEPFDPRTWPAFLIPLAVIPFVGLVVLVMIAILVGIVIETYLSSGGVEESRG